MNEELKGRLINWKFDAATEYLQGEESSLSETVRSLSRLFGNSGWFDGDMGHLVSRTVASLVDEK